LTIEEGYNPLSETSANTQNVKSRTGAAPVGTAPVINELSKLLFILLLQLNQIQCRAGSKPFNLLLIVSVVDLDGFLATISMNQFHSQGLLRCKILQIYNIDCIIFLNLVIVGLICKGQCKHTLFLEVCLMDTGKTLDQNHSYPKVTWFHRSMFTRGPFSIVVVPHHYTTNAGSLVLTLYHRYTFILTCQLFLDLISSIIEVVDCTGEQVVRNIIEVSSILKPWTSHRNMVCCTLALGLDKELQTHKVLSVPGRKRFKQLQSIRLGVNLNFYLATILSRSNITGIFNCKTSWWQVQSFRFIKFHCN